VLYIRYNVNINIFMPGLRIVDSALQEELPNTDSAQRQLSDGTCNV
jgi:hypothetical protein